MHAAAEGLDIPLGQTLEERFVLEAEIGAGGMGRVFRATDLLSGTEVAVKLINPRMTQESKVWERFRREATAMASICHPAVVQVRHLGELPGGQPFLVMQLLKGETLEARIERCGPMSANALLPIVRNLSEGLQAVHESGILHRDIKPANIFLPDGSSDENVDAMLMDFGIARIATEDRMTESGVVVGTARYMAPEQLTGSPLDERADLYSLGVVMYEALTGRHPCAKTGANDLIGAVLLGRCTPLSALRPDLPPALTQVIHRAMSRLATDRFASTLALSDAYEAAVEATTEGLDSEVIRSLTAPATPISAAPAHDVSEPPSGRGPAQSNPLKAPSSDEIALGSATTARRSSVRPMKRALRIESDAEMAEMVPNAGWGSREAKPRWVLWAALVAMSLMALVFANKWLNEPEVVAEQSQRASAERTVADEQPEELRNADQNLAGQNLAGQDLAAQALAEAHVAAEGDAAEQNNARGGPVGPAEVGSEGGLETSVRTVGNDRRPRPRVRSRARHANTRATPTLSAAMASSPEDRRNAESGSTGSDSAQLPASEDPPSILDDLGAFDRQVNERTSP